MQRRYASCSGTGNVVRTLMKAPWPDSFVEESNLNQQVSMIRRALGESANDARALDFSEAAMTTMAIHRLQDAEV